MKETELILFAEKASENAYAPYSGFKVGAALLCKNGKIYTGCNIENASYSPTNCAERTAFFKALSEGEREFEAIAVIGRKKGQAEDYCTPCGVCRQVMAEFCSGDFRVIMGKTAENFKVLTLRNLLPERFTLDKE